MAMPDNLLLEIMGYLPLKDVCRICRVCKQWRRVACDNRIWRHVNLLPYKLNLRKTWKMIRAHFSEVLLTLRMRGYLDPAGASWKKATLSEAILRDLVERCPNMVTLELTQANLTNVTIDNLPPKIKTLIITDSLVSPKWFQSLATKNFIMSKLERVDLSNSSKTSNNDVKHLCRRPSITDLKLDRCYRITDEGFQAITEHLNLFALSLEETAITDLAVRRMSRNLKGLCRLNLSRCMQITDGAVTSVASGLNMLEMISFAHCPQITEEAVKKLARLKKSVKHIDLTGLSVSTESIDELKKKLPRCTIIQ